MAQPVVTHCIFDLDGLLQDTEPLYTRAISTCLAKFGATFTEDLELATTGTTGRRKAQIIIDACGLTITPEEWVKMANETSWAMLAEEKVALMPGAERLTGIDIFVESRMTLQLDNLIGT